MEKIGDINARRVRDAILAGVNIRQAKQGPSFFFFYLSFYLIS